MDWMNTVDNLGILQTFYRDGLGSRGIISAYPYCGRNEEGEWHLKWCLYSQVTVTHDGALLSWNTSLSIASNKWICWFGLLACVAFALFIELCLFALFIELYLSQSISQALLNRERIVWMAAFSYVNGLITKWKLVSNHVP